MTPLKTISARFGPWLLFFLPPLIVVFIFGTFNSIKGLHHVIFHLFWLQRPPLNLLIQYMYVSTTAKRNAAVTS